MMNPMDAYAQAWEGIRSSVAAERLAHAYVIVGSPRGNALEFAESFLKLLYCTGEEKPCNECTACKLVGSHQHVDNLWIEPRSKSRQILADDVRALIHRMTQTSFDGGWKAGVIVSADCMNESSENALLKTLEEPPKKSLLLLVTDSPQALLPTILSRCQKMVLSSRNAGVLEELWKEPVMSLLQDLPPSGGLGASRLAGRLKSILDSVKSEIADGVEEEFFQDDEAMDETKVKEVLAARINARLKEVQSDLFRVMIDWQRDLLMLTEGVDEALLVFLEHREMLVTQASNHTSSSALNAVRAMDAMAQRLERNIPDLQIFDEGFRSLIR